MAGSQKTTPSLPLNDPALSARVEALYALADRTSERIIVVDRDQTIIYANQTAWKESTVSQSESHAPKCYEAFLEQTGPCERCPAEQVFESGKVQTVGNDGPSCGVHQAYPLMGKDGKTESVLVLFTNEALQAQGDNNEETSFSTGTRLDGPADRRRLGELIGTSDSMQKVFNLVRLVADSQATVLLLGESGTGKELVARTIHQLSARRTGPFVVVDCGALPESLLESELFGHVKGAFTGAHSSKRGLLEEADGGTLFLDEIGDTSPSFQSKLLRVLQEGEIKPVGSSRSLRVDVRVISATNKDLTRMIKEKKFREDLYYRLSVLPLVLPSLRERPEDIPLLVEHFIGRASQRNCKPVRLVSDSAMADLIQASWQGNVRELQHLIERVVVTASGSILESEDFFPRYSDERPSSDLRTLSRQASQQVEKKKILQALQKTSGNRAKAARLLGISRASFYNKLRAYDIA